MKNLALFFILVVLMCCMSFTKHPIHLSITEIDFKNNEIQIAHRLFIDDLELALRKKYPELKFNLATAKQLEHAEKYIFEYIQAHFDLSVNNIKKNVVYIGLEYDPNTVWIYGLVKNHLTTSQKEKISIKNAILTDLYDDQRVMTYLSKKDSKEFLNFEVNKLFQHVEL